MDMPETGPYWLTRFFFQKSLGFIYFIAFLTAFNQYKALLGENGILPVPIFLRKVQFWDAPSLFWLHSSDKFVLGVLGLGVLLSVAAATGVSEQFGIYFSAAVWLLLWVFYLSIVNVGQTWYAFGWESILLETGFFAIFLGSKNTAPPEIIIWILKWVLFRVMFGAGLIKLRADPCWRDLTCLTYHYETQPMPSPLSSYFHHLPVWAHKGGVLFTHLAELIVPFAIFLPSPFSWAAGIVMILFQTVLILSGNLSFLNYITLILCIPCFNDNFFKTFLAWEIPSIPALGTFRSIVLAGLFILVVILSIQPALNLFSERQAMNRSYNPFHLVNTYGAFGSVTKKRYEIIVEGTDEAILNPSTQWKEYEFKGKPGDPKKRPPQIAPYHLRLDWLMWFAAMSEPWYHPWFLKFVKKLLEGNDAVLKLLAKNPFPDKPPRHIRAQLYLYQFADSEKKKEGYFWQRSFIRDYLSPVSLKDLQTITTY